MLLLRRCARVAGSFVEGILHNRETANGSYLSAKTAGVYLGQYDFARPWVLSAAWIRLARHHRRMLFELTLTKAGYLMLPRHPLAEVGQDHQRSRHHQHDNQRREEDQLQVVS